MFFGPYGDKFGARRTFGYCLIAAGISMVNRSLKNKSIYNTIIK